MKKKIMMILLLVLPFISNFTSVNGDELANNTNNVINKPEIVNSRFIQNGSGDKFEYEINQSKKMTITDRTTGKTDDRDAVVMKLNGSWVPVYCIQPEITPISGSGIESTQTWDTLNPTQQKNISRIVQVADSKVRQGLSNDYQLAAQILIWEQLGYSVETKTFDVSQQLNEINAELRTYDLLPSFANQTISLTYNPITKRSEAVITDTNNVLATKFPNLNNISINGYQLTLNNNTLKISTQDYTNKRLTIDNTTTGNKTRWQPVDNGQPGYLVSSNAQDTVYGLDSYVDFSFNVQPRNGKISLSKKDDYNQPLAGSVFNIYQDVNANQVIDQDDYVFSSVTSDVNGNVESDLLPDGNYVIKEVKAPRGYVNGGYEEAFSINGFGNTYALNNNQPVINKKIEGFVEVIKMNEQQVRLANAEFSVYQDINGNQQLDDTDQLVTTLTTDSNGYSATNLLAGGDYIIKETVAPAGYVNNDELLHFSINADTVSKVGPNKLIASFEVINKREQVSSKTEGVKTGNSTNMIMLIITVLTSLALLITINKRRVNGKMMMVALALMAMMPINTSASKTLPTNNQEQITLTGADQAYGTEDDIVVSANTIG